MSRYLKKTLLDEKYQDQDHDKNQDKDQEKNKDQNQTEINQNKASNNVHQDLPKELRTSKDHSIQNDIGDFSKGVTTRHSLNHVCLILFPKFS